MRRPGVSSSATRDHPTRRPTPPRIVRVGAGRGVDRRCPSSGSCCLATRQNAVLMMLATVSAVAVAGMLNYHQRGDVWRTASRLLKADDRRRSRSGQHIAEARRQVAPSYCSRSPGFGSWPVGADRQPGVDAPVWAKGHRSTSSSGTTGHPKASVAAHLRLARALAGFGGLGLRLRRRHPVFLPAALSQQRALTVAVSSVLSAGATLALGRKFSRVRFWDDVIRYDAAAFIYIGELCIPPQPARQAHRPGAPDRLIAGNGLRPEIWDEFVAVRHQAGLRVLRAASGATPLHQHLQHPRSTGISPIPGAGLRSSTTPRPADKA